jgi:hypothetical protein
MYSTLSAPVSSSGSRRVPIRISVERPSGGRHHVEVQIDRSPSDDDHTMMCKASAEFRRLHGFADRIVAIYVPTTR